MFCAATDIIISAQYIIFPLGSHHDNTTDGHGKETNGNCNYVTDWIKHSDNGSRAIHVLQLIPLFTARHPPVGHGLLIIEASR